MLEKLKGLSQKYAEIEYMLSQSEVWADAQKAAALSREKAELAPLMEAYARYETFRQEAESAEELLSDPEMKDLARETLSEARSGMKRRSWKKLNFILTPPSCRSTRSAPPAQAGRRSTRPRALSA